MDTVMHLQAFGAQADTVLREAEGEIRRLDGVLDRHAPSGAVAAFNRGEALTDGDALALLHTALTVARATDGAFDPALAPLCDLWNFSGGGYLPSDAEIAALLPAANYRNISEQNGSFFLQNGAQIDLGGIAKGYAAGAVRDVFRKHGCVGTIDLGGDVCVVGCKPDGGAWRIAVRDPNDASAFLGTIAASDTFVTTSGSYERYFERDGVRYHHILDPRTGTCADSGIVSVTVVCADGAWADALSTAIFVMGEARALEVRDALADTVPFEFLLLTEDGTVRYTDALVFTAAEGRAYRYEAIA